MTFDFSYKSPALVRSKKVISVRSQSDEECFTIERYFKSRLQFAISLFFPHWCFNLRMTNTKTGEVMTSEDGTGLFGRPVYQVYNENGEALACFRHMSPQRLELTVNDKVFNLTTILFKKEMRIRKGGADIAVINIDKRLPPRTKYIEIYEDELDILLMLSAIHTFDVALKG